MTNLTHKEEEGLRMFWLLSTSDDIQNMRPLLNLFSQKKAAWQAEVIEEIDNTDFYFPLRGKQQLKQNLKSQFNRKENND